MGNAFGTAGSTGGKLAMSCDGGCLRSGLDDLVGRRKKERAFLGFVGERLPVSSVSNPSEYLEFDLGLRSDLGLDLSVGT
jgi:hypothetical protein